MSTKRTKGWIGQAIAGGAIKATAYHITLVYILPIGIPAVTGLIGYMSGYPWFWIWLGALAAFAFASNGLLRFDEWLDRRCVEDKLIFSHVRIVKNIKGPGFAIGAGLVSRASVPIEINFSEVRTTLNNRVPSIKTFDNTGFTVPPHGNAWFDDHIIDIGDPPHPGTIEGFAEFKIEYGRPGTLKHELIIKKQIVVAFNGDGFFERFSWNDAG